MKTLSDKIIISKFMSCPINRTEDVKEFIKNSDEIMNKWKKEAIHKYGYGIVVIFKYIEKEIKELAGDKLSK